MFNELMFVDGKPTPSIAYLGGSPYLPKSIQWPKDSSGPLLLHLASLTTIRKLQNEKKLAAMVRKEVQFCSGE